METTEQDADVRDRLINDLKLIIRDAENLLRGTGQQMDEGYRAARARFEETLSDARSGLSTLEERFLASSREALDTTNQYVQEHPWQSIGIGTLAGLVVGLWLGRR
ncbi:MAG TPA: DUF883 family protein [Noviherbaspirillum sp.]